MFISSATITENYTTYWEKVKSTVITGPPAEYVVRGVSAESFQVSLTGQTLSNSRYLVSHYRRSCLLLAWFPVLSTQEGGITFLANTCSTHRESCAEDGLFFKLENSAHSSSPSGGAQSCHGKWEANKL